MKTLTTLAAAACLAAFATASFACPGKEMKTNADTAEITEPTILYPISTGS